MSGGEVRLDLEREHRIGIQEAILCEHKSDALIADILDEIGAENRSALLTRLAPEAHERLASRHTSALDYDPVSRTGFFNWSAGEAGAAEVAVLTAGSSDVPVAREAMRVLAYSHVASLAVVDVGVAGLWRLTERIDEVRAYPIVIVAAGMDAALPSVVAGLHPGLVIAVPTSVGYGVAAGGQTALNAVLASCASGIAVVNIDNGYGAACIALRALNAFGRRGG